MALGCTTALTAVVMLITIEAANDTGVKGR
ncbi:hypothetical protein ABIB57_000176 [Devosia sp. UYZn731]